MHTIKRLQLTDLLNILEVALTGAFFLNFGSGQQWGLPKTKCKGDANHKIIIQMHNTFKYSLVAPFILYCFTDSEDL